MKDNFSGFQNATAPSIVCGWWPQSRVQECSAPCMPWLSSENWWRSPRSKSRLGFALQQHLQLTHSHSRKSLTPGEPAKQTSISPPNCSEQCCLLSFCSMGRKNFPKMFLFQRATNAHDNACSFLFAAQKPMRKSHTKNIPAWTNTTEKWEEPQRRKSKPINLSICSLAMTTNNKNYIWGHDIILILLFVEALYKRRLTRIKCWFCWGDSQLSGASQDRSLQPLMPIGWVTRSSQLPSPFI